MGSFCKPKTDSAGNKATSQSTASANAAKAASMDGSQQAYDDKNQFQKIVSDVGMDLGLIDKDNQYYANLANRQQASQDALNKQKKKKNKPKVDDKPVEEVDDTEDTTDDTTVLDEKTDTALDTVEDISNQTFDNTDNISNYFDNTATSVATAAGQEQNQASALTTSVGEAEDDAIDYMTTGTLSNVVNTGGAQGLLVGDDEDEDDPFNRKKTLIGA
tara:strand:+ start:1864 stop:2514 length:651 start_codon:yes stop_codon:yes gene_type:complete